MEALFSTPQSSPDNFAKVEWVCQVKRIKETCISVDHKPQRTKLIFNPVSFQVIEQSYAQQVTRSLKDNRRRNKPMYPLIFSVHSSRSDEEFCLIV